MSARSLWSVVTCGVLCLAGCAAAQVDMPDDDSGSGNAPSGPKAGTGGGTVGTGVLPKGGSTSNSTAGTTAKAGTGSGGEATGGSSGSGGGGGGSGGMKMVPPANTNLPYTEDFEDGTPQGFIPWNEDLMAGVWNVIDDPAGKIFQPQAPVAELEFAVGGSTTWNDVKLTVKVRLATADSRAHILLRMKEPKTYLVVEMAEGTYKLRGRADGSTTDIVAPSPKPIIVAGTWYTVGVSAKGSAVALTLDDMPIGSGSAHALITNGGIALGVAEGSAAFDDVNVVVAE